MEQLHLIQPAWLIRGLIQHSLLPARCSEWDADWVLGTQTGLVPGADIGMGGAGPGCFKGGTDVTKGAPCLALC